MRPENRFKERVNALSRGHGNTERASSDRQCSSYEGRGEIGKRSDGGKGKPSPRSTEPEQMQKRSRGGGKPDSGDQLKERRLDRLL